MLLNFLCGICFLSLSICAWVLTWNLLLMWNNHFKSHVLHWNGRWIRGGSLGYPEASTVASHKKKWCLWRANSHNSAMSLLSRHNIIMSHWRSQCKKKYRGMEGEYLNYSTQTLFHKLIECGYEDHKEPCDPINYAFTMAWMLTPGNYRSTSLLCTR